MKPSEYNRIIRPMKCKDGYVRFYDPWHPLASKSGEILLHRHLYCLKINEWIGNDVQVHHVDLDKSNNSMDNLVGMSSVEHRRLHDRLSGKQLHAVDEKCCAQCGGLFRARRRHVLQYCSKECFEMHKKKISWPEIDELLRMLKASSVEQMARQLDVSGNAIRKHLIRRGYRVKRGPGQFEKGRCND